MLFLKSRFLLKYLLVVNATSYKLCFKYSISWIKQFVKASSFPLKISIFHNVLQVKNIVVGIMNTHKRNTIKW